MRILTSSSNSGIDISSITEVIRYFTNSAALVTTRITLSGIVGSSLYRVRLYLNDVEVVPDPDISVSSTDVVFQSRAIWVNTSDTLSVSVAGTISDTAVDVDCYMIDVSPAAEAETDQIMDAVDEVKETVQNLINLQRLLYDRQVLGA